jgi:hypothetical protein
MNTLLNKPLLRSVCGGLPLQPLVIATTAAFLSAIFVADAQSPLPSAANNSVHRYLVERTLPAGALDGLDAALKAKVNANNAKYHVRWVMSYANAAKTKTYCIDEGPSEAAIRKASAANGLPIDSVTEIPVTLLPK